MLSGSVVLACCFLCISLTGAAQTLPSDAQPTCTVSSSMFNGFFQRGTAKVNGVADPANSITFPNNTALHNCDFYQWAEQMFIWLTSPAPASYGGGGGRIFASPAFSTVTPADPTTGKRTLIANPANGLLRFNLRAAQVGVHGLPVIMSNSGQMFEVQPGPVSKAGRPLVLNSAGKQIEVARMTLQNGRAVLMDSAGQIHPPPKLIVPRKMLVQQLQQPHPVEEKIPPSIAQRLRQLPPRAVDSRFIAQNFVINRIPIFLNVNGGVIDTEEGQADDGVLLSQNGSLIYYVTMVNDVMAYFLTATKNGTFTPPPTQFPTTAADLAKITTFATAHGKTFPDPNALAIEVKSSWVEAAGLPNVDQYITTQAVIPTYDKSNPNQWVPNGQKTTTLALIGMHVVGSANGHPEMIWATFEHFGNAPNATYKYNATSGTNPHTVNQSTTGTWLFCANGSAGPFNTVHARFNSPNIDGVSGPIGPSNIIRFKPFGAAFGTQPNPLITDDAASNTQIIAIDNSILQGFAPLSGGPDIRTNYFMTGATWTEGGARLPAASQRASMWVQANSRTPRWKHFSRPILRSMRSRITASVATEQTS